MQTITITHEHLTEARDLTEQARATHGAYNQVCLVAVAARAVNPTVVSVGFRTLQCTGGRALYVMGKDSDTVFRLIQAFDRQRFDDVAALLPFTFEVTEL